MVRSKPISKIKFKDIILNQELYSELPRDLVKLPLPDVIRIKNVYCRVPKDLAEFTKNICYGQRMFLAFEEKEDLGRIIRMMDGYFYPLVTSEKWDWDNAILFGKNILNCKAKDLYPVAKHLVEMVNLMADREVELLHRNPSKMEIAAGIENLNVFSELSSLDFLRDDMKVSAIEVLLTPYNECLVRFRRAKVIQDFQNKYFELMKETSEKPKNKRYEK